MSRKVVEEMRSFYPRRPRPRPFLFNFSSSSSLWPMEEEILSWADGYLRPQLEPCVKRVIELDNDDGDYMAVLKEPFILNEDIMSGAYPRRGVALAYIRLLRNSPRINNDFVTVQSSVYGERRNNVGGVSTGSATTTMMTKQNSKRNEGKKLTHSELIAKFDSMASLSKYNAKSKPPLGSTN